MVTHDARAAAYADEVLFLADGQVGGRLSGASVETIATRMTHLGDKS
jgi:ATPase component of ABC-type antimicrobial peptide transport system